MGVAYLPGHTRVFWKHRRHVTHPSDVGFDNPHSVLHRPRLNLGPVPAEGWVKIYPKGQFWIRVGVPPPEGTVSDRSKAPPSRRRRHLAEFPEQKSAGKWTSCVGGGGGGSLHVHPKLLLEPGFVPFGIAWRRKCTVVVPELAADVKYEPGLQASRPVSVQRSKPVVRHHRALDALKRRYW
jgi:hypothetical protein